MPGQFNTHGTRSLAVSMIRSELTGVQTNQGISNSLPVVALDSSCR